MEKPYKKFFEKKKVIEIPNIPNTLNFFHGGNLDNYNDVIAQKSGRYEYGAGLYLITHYGTALKYAKGSRKLYLITVEKGNDIKNALLPLDAVLSFIDQYVIGSKKKEFIDRLQKYTTDGKVKAYIFNNIILNDKMIKSINTYKLREFYVSNGIDYEMVSNPFGWGEDMMVLYNMKKIVNIIQITSNDELPKYDLKESEFNREEIQKQLEDLSKKIKSSPFVDPSDMAERRRLQSLLLTRGEEEGLKLLVGKTKNPKRVTPFSRNRT
jgi:hypothetical protein